MIQIIKESRIAQESAGDASGLLVCSRLSKFWTKKSAFV